MPEGLTDPLEAAAQAPIPAGAGAVAADAPVPPADPRAHRRRMYFRAVWSGAFARAVNIAVQALSISLTVRYLGKERFGVWATISTMITWLSMANLGIGNGLTTRIAALEAEGRRDQVYRAIVSALGMIAAVTLALAPLCLLVVTWLPWPRILNVATPLAAAESTPTVVVAVVLVLATLPLNLIGSALLGYQRGDLVNVTSVACSAVGLAVLFVATRLHWGMPALAATLMFPVLAAAAVQWAVALRLRLVRFARHDFCAADARPMLRLGLKFLFLQLYSLVIFETSALIIARHFGAAEVTPYSVTNRVVMIIGTVMTIALTPLWPAYGDAFARGDTAWARRVFFKSVRLVLVIWAVAAASLAVGGRAIIGLWAGPAAVPGTGLLWSMLLYTLAFGGGLVVAQPLYGAGRLNVQVVAALVTGSLHIPLALFLVARAGVAGVVISQTVLLLALAIPIQLVGVLRLLEGKADAAPPDPQVAAGVASAGAPPQDNVEALAPRQAP